MLLLLLIVPVFSHAAMALSHTDGLFDFQMKMAKRGNAEAQFKVGEMYETGFGVKQDKQKGIKWIKKAAKNGHETASFKLLYWDLEKNGITSVNKTEFAALKAKAAAANHQAMYYMGEMYAHGIGVKTNYEKSLQWLNKAALVGIQSAEQEMDAVREKQQLQKLAKRRASEKKHAQLKARQAAEKQKQLQAQRKLQLQKQQQAKALAKAQIEALHKKQQTKAATAAVAVTRKIQKQKKQKQRTEAAKKAHASARRKVEQLQTEQLQLEAKKQALLRKRVIQERQRKERFESDPCSGKSARFLSTCR